MALKCVQRTTFPQVANWILLELVSCIDMKNNRCHESGIGSLFRRFLRRLNAPSMSPITSLLGSAPQKSGSCPCVWAVGTRSTTSTSCVCPPTWSGTRPAWSARSVTSTWTSPARVLSETGKPTVSGTTSGIAGFSFCFYTRKTNRNKNVGSMITWICI